MPNDAFNVDEPLAYFITWTTYGTWLPGDARGWNKHGAGTPLPPNKFLEEFNRSAMKESEFVLSESDRELIQKTIQAHCKVRNWTLHAVNVRTNHVHVVVTAPDYGPHPVRDQLKAWCTRRLREVYPSRKRFWTEGSSNRFINKMSDLEAAVLYVLEAQD